MVLAGEDGIGKLNHGESRRGLFGFGMMGQAWRVR